MTDPLLEVAFVDVGGTLISELAWDRDMVRTLRSERVLTAGVPASRLDQLMTLVEEAEARAVESTHYDVDEVLASVLQAASLPEFSPEVLRRALVLPLRGATPLLDGAADLLESLRSEGLRCFLLTNAFVLRGADSAEQWGALGLLPLIAGIVSSVDTRWRKPDRRMFDAALDLAQTVPDRCVMIGNSEAKDIVPARALGMRTIRVCLEEPPAASSAADAVCGSLREVADLVAEIRRTRP